MAGHTAEELPIEGRRVKIATGTRSQTINVCTPVNSLGTYEQVYRIGNPKEFVSPSQLPKRLGELESFLESRGAIKEGPRRR